MELPVICCQKISKEMDIAILNNEILAIAHTRWKLLVDFGKNSRPNPIKIEAKNERKGTIQINWYISSINAFFIWEKIFFFFIFFWVVNFGITNYCESNYCEFPCPEILKTKKSDPYIDPYIGEVPKPNSHFIQTQI